MTRINRTVSHRLRIHTVEKCSFDIHNALQHTNESLKGFELCTGSDSHTQTNINTQNRSHPH